MSSVKFVVVVLALLAVFAMNTSAQFVYNWPAYYSAYYNPYWGYVWGSDKGKSADAPMPPSGGPAPSVFTNNAPKF
uniref:Uncharacterized protein n=2 Tax=Panagrolaimus sp. JU765 TaxID=591449 RepID=A0AC34R734_9BILA